MTITATPPRSTAEAGAKPAASRRVDGRVRAARRFKALVAELTAELGGDLASSERLAVESAAGLTVQAEQMREGMLRGEPVSADDLVRVTNMASRQLNVLRRRKSAAPAGPSALQAFLAQRAAEAGS